MATVVSAIHQVSDLMRLPVLGEMPDSELQVEPRWIIFQSTTEYKKASYIPFKITNMDPFSVAWCIKTKDKQILRLSQSHGMLLPGETKELKLFVMPCEEWPRDVTEHVMRRIKLAVENLRISETIRPKSKTEQSLMSREIFRRSVNEIPLVRFYTKISVVLEKSGGSRES